jgi:hypothetical protein
LELSDGDFGTVDRNFAMIDGFWFEADVIDDDDNNKVSDGCE